MEYEFDGIEIGFQSYQIRQINPDKEYIMDLTDWMKKFQSYQFRQINPDVVKLTYLLRNCAQINYTTILYNTQYGIIGGNCKSVSVRIKWLN